MSFLTDIGNNLHNLWNQGTQAVGNEIHQLPQQAMNLGKAVINQQNNPLLSSPMQVPNVPRIQLPNFQLQNHPLLNFAANNVVKPMATGLINTPTDLFNASNQTRHDFYTGQIGKPQTALADIGASGQPAMNLALPGGAGKIGADALEQAGKQGLLQVVKSGAINGGLQGALYGLFSGLAQGRNGTLKDQLVGAGKSTAIGAGTGAALGGTLSGAGYALGQIRNGLSSLLQQKHGMTPEEADQAVTAWARDKAGRFTQAKKPNEAPVYASQVTGLDSPQGIKITRGGQSQQVYGDLDQAVQDLLDKSQKGFIDFGAKVGGPEDNAANPALADTGGQSPVLPPEANTVERKFVTSVKESPEVSPQVQSQAEGQYTVQPNQVLTNQSDQLLSQGLDKATNDVTGALSQKGKGVISDQTVSDAIAVAKAHDAAGNFDQATQIYNDLAEQLTKAGRTVQAASLLNNRTPQGLLFSAVKTLKGAGVEITPEVNGNLEGFINAIKQTDPGTDERNMATQRLVQYVNENIPRSKIAAAMGIWRAGLLTGPETVAKVAVSHGITTPFEMASQIPASLADRLMSLVTGERSMTATTQGFGEGLGEGLQAAKTKLTTGLDEPGSGGFESDFGSSTTQTPYENFVGNVHGALSKPTYNARFQNSLYDQALTDAGNQGLAGEAKDAFVQDFVTNPSDAAKTIASNDAAIATNQQTTSAGKLASTLQSFSPGGVPVGKFLVPFTRIPSAIGVNGLVNYTPFGIPAEVVSQVRSGVFNQRTLAQAIGRSATGTTILALGALLGAHGLMTLKAPSDAKERALWDAEHKQPNSFKLGDKWISLNAFGPVGLVLGMGGAFGQSLKQNGGNVVGAVESAMAGGGRLLVDQPYLKGIAGVANALNDPTRYGQTLFNSTAGSVVPAISSQIARGTDNVQRMFPKDLKGQFQGEIPGLRQNLAPTRDLYGNTIPGANPSNSIAGGVAGTINPFYPSQGTSDPITSELQRLYDTLGSSDAPNIAPPSANQTVYGNKVKLSNQQISNFVQQEGPQVQQALQTVMSDPSYQQLTDIQKSNVINQAISQYKNSDLLMQNSLQNQPGTTGTGANTSTNTIKITPTSGQKGSLSSYQLKAAQDAFANSPNTFQDLGSVVLRKDAAGNVTAQSKDAYNTSLYEAQMTGAKNALDYQTFRTVGDQLMGLYQKQLNDPNVDQLDKAMIMNKMTALQKSLDKTGKAKKGARISIKGVAAPKTQAFKSPTIKLSGATKKFGSIKQPKLASTKPAKSASFKIASPRIFLSSGTSSQRGIRKAAGISVPVARRKQPVLTV